MENVYVLKNSVYETPVKEKTLWGRFKNYVRENALLISCGLATICGNTNIAYYYSLMKNIEL